MMGTGGASIVKLGGGTGTLISSSCVSSPSIYVWNIIESDVSSDLTLSLGGDGVYICAALVDWFTLLIS